MKRIKESFHAVAVALDHEYTGRLWEIECMGVAIWSWLEKRIPQPAEHKTFRSAMKWLIELVDSPTTLGIPWESMDPSGLLSELFVYVAEGLGVVTMDELRVYAAPHTALDLYHGVDLFFVNKGRFVSVDCSTRDKSAFKAHVLWRPSHTLGQKAEEIVRCFQGSAAGWV